MFSARALIGFGLLFAAAVAYFLSPLDRNKHLSSAPMSAPVDMIHPLGNESPPEPRSSSAASKPAGEYTLQVAQPPTVQTLREEVKSDPHATPPSLLRFGVDMGVRMKDAKNSQAAAESLLAELEACSHPEDAAQSAAQARALCIVSARELEQTWPALHERVNALVGKADPEALKLASHLDPSLKPAQ